MARHTSSARRAVAALAAVACLTGAGAPASGAEPAEPDGRDAAATVAPSPSAGCGTESPPVGAETRTIASGGVERSYIRHVPPAHDGNVPVPLVIAIHGLAEGSVLHQQTTELPELAAAEGFALAFPQGLGDPAIWRTALDSADVALIGDLLDELEADLCLDRNRIHVSGFSMGAFMTSSVACVYADRVASVAPVAGLLDPPGCSPSRPVPLLSFHGTADTWVPYEPTPGYAAAWAARNGCDGPPTEELVGSDEVVEIHRISHPCGPDAAPVELYRIDDGGHAWPGSEFSRTIAGAVGYTTFEINATETIWSFFQDHPLRAESAPADGAITGSVVGPDGAPVDDAWVLALGPDDTWAGPTGLTGSDGSFAIDGLAPGPYQLMVVPPAGSGQPNGWYGATRRQQATTLEVEVGSQHTGVVVSLGEAGAVSGSVTGPDGQPLAGVSVWAYHPDDAWVGSAATSTRADGTYTLDAVVGEYRVAFFPPAGSGLARQWSEGSTTRSAATPVNVTASTTVSGVDAQLSPSP